MEALASPPRALSSSTASPASVLAATVKWASASSARRPAAGRVSASAAEPAGDAKPAAAAAAASGSADAAAPAPKKILKKKPVYSMKKGQIVRVEKEKYLNSINYLSVGHPPFYKGLDYIYENRGEVLDIRIFETGEYALDFIENTTIASETTLSARALRYSGGQLLATRVSSRGSLLLVHGRQTGDVTGAQIELSMEDDDHLVASGLPR
ncbi:NAD(P)H-quinone oxidoreductase subunit O, chloroplastic-like [Lolium rigidum]|uniref:NAD(P)H-quinone oxidoreductase subunit O, chloroplastic-like n=1 Tax=Lolium rigidum TaxID=89674 RepID=UPI001F5D0ED2|nr:NAD(P)H-quinone oxidoreductase subunit O, chloroplastic-like [Lolium rigidum]